MLLLLAWAILLETYPQNIMTIFENPAINQDLIEERGMLIDDLPFIQKTCKTIKIEKGMLIDMVMEESIEVMVDMVMEDTEEVMEVIEAMEAMEAMADPKPKPKKTKTVKSSKEILRMLRMLELNGLFTAALGLMYYDLLNKDLPQFISFSRNFWNRVLNSLFNSVSVFWLPQVERNFVIIWHLLLVLLLATCLVWEILKVSIICGSGFSFCKIPPDSTHRKTQITGNAGNSHEILGSFERMHCKGGNMDDSFELAEAVALHQNLISSHNNLFNDEDSKQNKKVNMFDPQNLLKLANDIESNPGPGYMFTIQEFLDGNNEYRSQNKEKLLQAVSKLDKDAKEGKIQTCMYTEQNLITLYNIFDVSIREKYPQKIMTEIENLSNHWNKEVRQEELRLRLERKERSELVIAINPDETTESNKERENADNNTEQHVLQGQMTGQRKPKVGTRKGKQYKMKTSSVKKNRLHRGDWNPYGPKKNLELPVHREPPN